MMNHGVFHDATHNVVGRILIRDEAGAVSSNACLGQVGISKRRLRSETLVHHRFCKISSTISAVSTRCPSAR